MSPFSQFLHDLRMRRGMRQSELAEAVGYEPSYISALELGIKGPPTDEFLARLIQTLSMSLPEQDTLREMALASQRKLILDADAPTDLYWLLNDLRTALNYLHPVQVKLIREVIDLPHSLLKDRATAPVRIKRKRKEEVSV